MSGILILKLSLKILNAIAEAAVAVNVNPSKVSRRVIFSFPDSFDTLPHNKLFPLLRLSADGPSGQASILLFSQA